jgi:hypothetical protein
MPSRVGTLSDEELWTLAHRVAETKSRGFDVTAVPEPLGVALTVELVQGIIDNGGVEYLLGPDLPRALEYSDCVRALKVIESWLCAEALAEVYRAFPGGSPQNSTEARSATLEGLLETRRTLFDRASRTFWDASESNYAAALRLMRAHPEVFDAVA